MTSAERAFREIRERILSGALTPGVLKLESELAEELGLSRTPTREAMVRLADEGLVELRARHGMRVKAVSAEDMREIYEVLTELEAAAARRCAARGLSDEVLGRLEAAVAAMDKALARDDLRGWGEADETFHRALLDACGNSRMAATANAFSDKVRRARMATLHVRPKPVASNDDHRALVAAIRARNPAAAEAIHRTHRERAGQMLAGLLERLPALGA
jgi:DNA-binding GntR family transcriptional regulator